MPILNARIGLSLSYRRNHKSSQKINAQALPWDDCLQSKDFKCKRKQSASAFASWKSESVMKSWRAAHSGLKSVRFQRPGNMLAEALAQAKVNSRLSLLLQMRFEIKTSQEIIDQLRKMRTIKHKSLDLVKESCPLISQTTSIQARS